MKTTTSAGEWAGRSAAAVSRIAPDWRRFPDLRPKCRLQVMSLCGVKLQMQPVWQLLGVRATNIGKEPVVASGIAVRCRGRAEECFLVSRNLHKRLEPNESIDELFDPRNGLPTDAEALYANDSSGGEWRLPQNRLKQLLEQQEQAAGLAS
jgi:hypothetical protein